jgi:hypothetical protein
MKQLEMLPSQMITCPSQEAEGGNALQQVIPFLLVKDPEMGLPKVGSKHWIESRDQRMCAI